MDETLRKMMLDEAVVDAQQHAKLLASSEAAIAALTSGEDVQPVWSIMISSVWATEGEKSHTGDYATPTLREAIRQAATDFCVKNRRIYPGKPADSGRQINEPFSKHPTVGTLGTYRATGTLAPSWATGRSLCLARPTSTTSQNYATPQTKSGVPSAKR
jgi:hypothetical protein